LVQFRPLAPYNVMGYEIFLIAHFCYVLVMNSTAVKGFQCLFLSKIQWWLDFTTRRTYVDQRIGQANLTDN